MKLPSTAASFRCISITKNDNDSLKHFPKGAFFAFSGVFFVLTLLVLFQSPEPFGLAAIVAYIACLSLTILLFSAPYFAAYFINYYRKLHQIEEAILLLSEHQKVASSDDPPLPPYSAVSLLETDDDVESAEEPVDSHWQSDAADESSGDGDHTPVSRGVQNASESESSEMIQPSEPPIERRRKARKDAMLESQDEFQLSLFFPNASHEKQADSLDTEGKADPETEEPLTEILAYCLLDDGSEIYLRGDPPFSWKEGIKMISNEVGKYHVDPLDLQDPIQVCFLLNDDEKRMSRKWEVKPTTLNECYPEF